MPNQPERYFRPRNWSKFQSRSNNSMAWVKNYTALLTDPDYLKLSGTQRAVLHGVWMLCGVRQRPIEWSSRYLGRTLSIPSQCLGRCLGVLQSNNFIELCDATQNVHDELPPSREEKRREEEKIPPLISPPSEDPIFDQEFWPNHPRQRRGSKKAARAAWTRALTRAPAAHIMSGHIDYRDSDEVRDGFAKGAAAWLNDDRWTSDYRTYRTKTTAEQLDEWLHEEDNNGDQGNDHRPDTINGECVELSGQRPEGDRGSLSRGTARSVGRRRQGSDNGSAQRVDQKQPAETGRHPDDRSDLQDHIAGLARVAAKRAKP